MRSVSKLPGFLSCFKCDLKTYTGIWHSCRQLECFHSFWKEFVIATYMLVLYHSSNLWTLQNTNGNPAFETHQSHNIKMMTWSWRCPELSESLSCRSWRRFSRRNVQRYLRPALNLWNISSSLAGTINPIKDLLSRYVPPLVVYYFIYCSYQSKKWQESTVWKVYTLVFACNIFMLSNTSLCLQTLWKLY